MPLAETVGFVVNTVNVIVERVCLHTKTERQPRVVGSWRYNRQTHQIFNMFQLQNSTYYCKIALVGWNKHSNRHNGLTRNQHFQTELEIIRRRIEVVATR